MTDIVCNGRSLNRYIAWYKDFHEGYTEEELQRAVDKWIRSAKREKGTLKGSTPKEKKRTAFCKVKNAILQRDGHKCSECGSDKRLHVHHIKELAQGGDNSEDNLITLCGRCHAEKHKGQAVYNIMTK